MASTTQTTYYGLPQYIGSDRASWLDTNEPFAAVDTALHTAVTGVEQATTDVASLREDVAQAQLDVNALDGRMDTAELNIGQLQTTVAGHTGDIADVRRDLQDNIESLREETATSTHAYEIGDYFYYNDVLFKATAQIAIGATIVPNTNCTGVTVMDELKSGGVVSIDASEVTYGTSNVEDALDDKIDTFSGSVADASQNTYTAVTADGIAYDANNNQLLLKVNGADTVIPFNRGGGGYSHHLLLGFMGGYTLCLDMDEGTEVAYNNIATTYPTAISSVVNDDSVTVLAGVSVKGINATDVSNHTVIDEVLTATKTYTHASGNLSRTMLVLEFN